MAVDQWLPRPSAQGCGRPGAPARGPERKPARRSRWTARARRPARSMIDVRPVNPTIATISGVDLRKPFAPTATRSRTRFRHGVLFFRAQPVTPDEHIAFARQTGRSSHRCARSTATIPRWSCSIRWRLGEGGRVAQRQHVCGHPPLGSTCAPPLLGGDTRQHARRLRRTRGAASPDGRRARSVHDITKPMRKATPRATARRASRRSRRSGRPSCIRSRGPIP
jgi:hypothetical protein